MNNLSKYLLILTIILTIVLVALTAVFLNEKNAAEKSMEYIVENDKHIRVLYENIIDENYDTSTIKY